MTTSQTQLATALDKELMKDAPKDVFVRINHGRLLMAQGQPQEAIIFLQKVTSDAADSPQAHYYLAMAFWQNGDLGQARNALMDALKVSQGLPIALQALARANERALQLLVEKPSKAVDYVAWFLDRLTREEAQRYYEDYVRPYFVPGRTADLDMAQQAIDAVAAELGIAPVAAEAMYGLAGKSIASI